MPAFSKNRYGDNKFASLPRMAAQGLVTQTRPQRGALRDYNSRGVKVSPWSRSPVS